MSSRWSVARSKSQLCEYDILWRTIQECPLSDGFHPCSKYSSLYWCHLKKCTGSLHCASATSWCAMEPMTVSSWFWRSFDGRLVLSKTKQSEEQAQAVGWMSECCNAVSIKKSAQNSGSMSKSIILMKDKVGTSRTTPESSVERGRWRMPS